MQRPYSVSQLKTFNADKAKRAGQYILGIYNEKKYPNALAGTVFEQILYKNILSKGEYKYSVEDAETRGLKGVSYFDLVECNNIVESLLANSQDLTIPVGESNLKVEGQIAGYDFVGYIDNYCEDIIYDIKTTMQAKNLESMSMYSGMTVGDEYELQLRSYMYLLDKQEAKIVEINGYQYKNKPKDGTRKIIDYNRTEEMDTKRLKFISEKCGEMQELYNKHKKV